MDSPIDKLRKSHHYGRYKIVRELIKGKGKNLLDIGCGSPAACMKDASFLRFLGYGQGIDIVPRDIEFPFKIGSITDIPFPDKSFEVVTAIEVMEHIDNPLDAFKEILRVLKKGGTYVMSTPNNTKFFLTFWFFWEKTFGQEWHHTHLTEHRKEEWLEMIKKTGLFKIVRVVDHWKINTIYQLEKIEKPSSKKKSLR